MFVTLTRSEFFAGADHDDAKTFNRETQRRYERLIAEQDDETFLRTNCMPKVQKGKDYSPPVVTTHPSGAKHENAYVIINDAHTKQTNNGFKRGDSGGFYCH